jgi:hypothetical protein
MSFLVLSLTMASMATALASFLTTLQIIKRFKIFRSLPEGKTFYHQHENYEAIVVVDHSVVCLDGEYFVVGGHEKTSGKDLARSCALAMKATSETMRAVLAAPKDGPYSNKGNLCVFRFLGTKKFEEEAKETGFDEPKLINAYANLSNEIHDIDIPQSVFRSDFLPAVATKGDLAIHELIHVFGWAYYDYWDIGHIFWRNREYFIDGRNINKIGKERWKALNNRLFLRHINSAHHRPSTYKR